MSQTAEVLYPTDLLMRPMMLLKASEPPRLSIARQMQMNKEAI